MGPAQMRLQSPVSLCKSCPLPYLCKTVLFSFPGRRLPIARGRHVYQAEYLEVWHKICGLWYNRKTLCQHHGESTPEALASAQQVQRNGRKIDSSPKITKWGKSNWRRTNLFHRVCLTSWGSVQPTSWSVLRWKYKFFSLLGSHVAPALMNTSIILKLRVSVSAVLKGPLCYRLPSSETKHPSNARFSIAPLLWPNSWRGEMCKLWGLGGRV